MSSPSFLKRHRWWFISLAIAMAVVGAIVGGYYWIYLPGRDAVLSFLGGNPKIPGCTNTVKAEGPLPGMTLRSTYRITQHDCFGTKVYFVFLTPQGSPLSAPMFSSTQAPVPVAVHPRDARSLEIVLAEPVDGSDRLLVTINKNGVPEPLYNFTDGKRS